MKLTLITSVALILVLSAIACSPGSSEAEQAFTDGIDSYKKGLYVEDIVDFDKVIQLDHDYAKAYVNRSVAHGEVGQYSQQRADKAKACSLDSRYC